ncbi:MAG TPA: DUF2339 domain-containing protein [Thermoanaerobaculia bacterium]|nr:DUF2339 domain-containing protein [Thermoanaerobaculia bacterium]
MLGTLEFLALIVLGICTRELFRKLWRAESLAAEQRRHLDALAELAEKLRERVGGLEAREVTRGQPVSGAATAAREPGGAAPAVRTAQASAAARMEVTAPAGPPPSSPSAPQAHAAPPASQAPHGPEAPPPSRPSPPPPPPPPPARRPFDWESLVGVKLFSWIAGVLLALAAIQFLRFSIEHGWLTTPIRMAIGLATGAGLLVICEIKAARRYAVTANALDASGIVILFSTLFAAHSLWHLLASPATFALMALVTAVAVTLAIRHDSLFIALLGLLGGFATPALLATGEDRPISLFAYLLLLNAGLAWVALRRSWPVLSVISLALTTLYQWSWVARFLTAATLPLALGIFLAFPLLAFLVPVIARPRGDAGGAGDAGDAGRRGFARTAAVAAALPLLFAAYAAAVPAYGGRFALLFGFLIVLDAGLTAVAALRGPGALHPLAAAVSLLVFALWFGFSYNSAAWPTILGFLSLFVLFHLATPGILARLGKPLGRHGRLGALAASCLLAAFPVLLRVEPAAAAPGLTFGILFGLLAAVAVFALLYEQGSLHFIAAFFAIVAEAVWSAEHLARERLLAGIALYALFGLFYLGVPLLARRLGRKLEPRASGAVLLLLSLGLLFFLAAGPLAQAALWGLALLLVILNAGLFLEAGRTRLPLLSLAGIALSWVLIAAWWAAVPLAANLVPALLLVAGFAILGLAGNLWMRGEATGIDGTAGGGIGGEYLALVGHAFLLFVAMQASLAVPPWPLLGALALLDLAVGVAALWMRRAELWIGALAASDVILVVWVTQAGRTPWPGVAMACAIAVAALGLTWIALARRVEVPPGAFSRRVAMGAAACLFLGQVVLWYATGAAGTPSLAATTAANVALLAAILALSGPTGWPRLAPWSVATTAIAVACWRLGPPPRAGHAWWTELALSAAVYLPYLLFPPLLGRRARSLRAPYLAAVLASAAFFLFARDALDAGHLGAWIGALPVAQAVALGLLLVHLRRSEAAVAPAARDRGRLALVAGAVLAFITIAIPLQLDREWITIGWALLAAALAWLYTRVPHRGLLYWSAGLLTVTFLRLAVNPAVLSYHPRGGLPIWNWYLYTYLITALAFFVAARFLAAGDDRLFGKLPRLSALTSGAAVALLFLLLNIEIADSFSTGATLTFGFLAAKAGLGENLAYTLGWGIFAILLLVAGIALRNRAVRVAAIVLLLAASLKGFLFDMSQLGGLYRAGSFAGLAICLALVAVLIQKFVLSARREQA